MQRHTLSNNGIPGPNPTETVTGGKTLDLSKYDKVFNFIFAISSINQVRRPHKLITDDTKIKITSRTLSAELCCPICLDLLTCTMTTKECLHRFCSECITTALMRGNKECPTCRKKIVSKRSLRPDPNFDFLISKVLMISITQFLNIIQIWPDRKQYDVECVSIYFTEILYWLLECINAAISKTKQCSFTTTQYSGGNKSASCLSKTKSTGFL